MMSLPFFGGGSPYSRGRVCCNLSSHLILVGMQVLSNFLLKKKKKPVTYGPGPFSATPQSYRALLASVGQGIIVNQQFCQITPQSGPH